MEELRLVKPSSNEEFEVMSYKQEFMDINDSLDGTSCLQDCETFGEWMQKMKDNEDERTRPKGFVPSSTFLVLRQRDGFLVGMVDIRHYLNDHLLKVGGHIGYSVRPAERKKEYGTQILKLALDVCKTLAIKDVLVTCYEVNIGSKKIISNNGGVFENKVNDDKIVNRYWIHLQKE